MSNEAQNEDLTNPPYVEGLGVRVVTGRRLDIMNPGYKHGITFKIERRVADAVTQWLEAVQKTDTKGVLISTGHTYSLRRLVAWFKKMIEVQGQSNSELTAEYCDELMEALKIDE